MYKNLYLLPVNRNHSKDTVTNCFHLSKNNDAETKKILQINPMVEKGDIDPLPSAMFINRNYAITFKNSWTHYALIVCFLLSKMSKPSPFAPTQRQCSLTYVEVFRTITPS